MFNNNVDQLNINNNNNTIVWSANRLKLKLD